MYHPPIFMGYIQKGTVTQIQKFVVVLTPNISAPIKKEPCSLDYVCVEIS